MPDKVNGNINGLRKTYIERLERLYGLNTAKNEFITPEILMEMAAISLEIKREVAVYINRSGKLIDVSVGDHATVSLGEVKGRRSDKRLSGIRCIHTHPESSAELSDVDLTAMESLNLDAMAAVAVQHGESPIIYVCLNNRMSDRYHGKFIIYGPFSVDNLVRSDLMKTIMSLDKPTKSSSEATVVDTVEKAILCVVQKPGMPSEAVYDSLDELPS